MQDRGDLDVIFTLVRRNGVYRDLGNVRVHGEGGLHLKAGDVLATPAQIILFPIDEIEEAVVIELADISGVEPHVAHQLQRVLRTLPVALKHDVRAQRSHHNLTGRVRRYFTIFVIDNAYIEVRDALAG